MLFCACANIAFTVLLIVPVYFVCCDVNDRKSWLYLCGLNIVLLSDKRSLSCSASSNHKYKKVPIFFLH
uniref:Putative secreted protein synganglion overexpressed n=1 Tax=Rhipicephalus microplus TaxID=6941 RepID=A0A6M2DEQ9_RHIMP